MAFLAVRSGNGLVDGSKERKTLALLPRPDDIFEPHLRCSGDCDFRFSSSTIF